MLELNSLFGKRTFILSQIVFLWKTAKKLLKPKPELLIKKRNPRVKTHLRRVREAYSKNFTKTDVDGTPPCGGESPKACRRESP